MVANGRAPHAILAIALLAVVPGTASGFHSGGVGACEGCHTMHNSLEGESMGPALALGAAGPYLLQGSDESSTCLHCHQQSGLVVPDGIHVSTSEGDMPAGVPPHQLTPAGDFGWLKKTYTWVPRAEAAAETSLGERHGHSIVAADYGYQQDSAHPVAPGGTYPSAALKCNSCHDPHGKYRRLQDGTIVTTGLPIIGSGSYSTSADPTSWGAIGVYRHLGGIGYQPRSVSGSFAFVHGPPDAVAPPDYNRAEDSTQTRVAYGRGFGEWCANCHRAMLENAYVSGEAAHRHPAGDSALLTPAVISNYRAYLKSGDLNGSAASSFLSLVPFEEGTGDYARLKSHARTDDGYLEGPDARSTVMCLSCHRSHASAFGSKLRFGLGNEFMTVADPAGTPLWPDPSSAPAAAQGRTVAETQQAYYGRPAALFAPYQRVLCNKCHVKD
jgi:hypothetical protein